LVINRLDYDNISRIYDQRYTQGGPSGIASVIHQLVDKVQARCVLEIGCGTGYWLLELHDRLSCMGLDYSSGMLAKAREKGPSLSLVQGDASLLPFQDCSLDLVFCVNALHHFDQPEVFISEAYRLLRKRGVLVIVGMDPSVERDRWYVYDYFPETYQADLSRYPSCETIVRWMGTAGFVRCERSLAAIIQQDCLGREVLSQSFIHKNSTSQLALLSEEAYHTGIRRINADVALAEKLGHELHFVTDIALYLVYGHKNHGI